MRYKINYLVIKLVTTASYLLMLTANYLSNRIPINGVTTKQVSDTYSHLFVPARTTFIIWGVIYVLLGIYVLYQWEIFRWGKGFYESEVFRRVSVIFAATSIANALWVFAWHYFLIGISLLLMLFILVCLFIIVDLLKQKGFWPRLPFSIYFGWITVLTIANGTTFLVSIGWDGLGISEPTWTIIRLGTGLFIGITVALLNNDFVYGLAIIWAFTGILINHTTESGFNNQYPIVIITALGCIGLLLFVEGFIFCNKTRGLKISRLVK